MNNERRASISAVVAQVADFSETIDLPRESIEALRDEEQEYYDNMPESFQNADRGQAAQEAISYLEDAVSALDDFDADNLTASLESAAQ